MTDRRDFVRKSALLGFGASVPTFLGNTAFAAPTSDKPGAIDTVLVVVAEGHDPTAFATTLGTLAGLRQTMQEETN